MTTSEQSNPSIAPRYYEVGQILTLDVEPGPDNPTCKVIKVKVKQLQRRWTLSAGMIVEVLQPESLRGLSTPPLSKPIAFLKLFDRRWAQQIRRERKIEHWGDEAEELCVDLVKSGKAEEFLNRCHQDQYLEETEGSTWNPAENEVYLAHRMRTCYNNETTAYRVLEDVQGQIVPRLFARINMDFKPSSIEPSSTVDTVFQIKGVLLEYLDGFNLDALVQNAPRSAWQGIVDQALKILELIDSKSLLNQDARLENYIVIPEGEEAYRVYIIDWGHSRIRGEGESDAEWGKEKYWRDAEGAVGQVALITLRRFGFELNFEHSRKWDEFGLSESDKEELERCKAQEAALPTGLYDEDTGSESTHSSQCGSQHQG